MSTKNLILPNDVQEVPKLATFVDAICETAGMDMSTTMQMNLAIEEAVVNVMEYAYPAGTKGEVRIEAQIHEAYVEFILSDDGKPFNPKECLIGSVGFHIFLSLVHGFVGPFEYIVIS